MTIWELRYRAARAIDNVLIETFGETEEEAKALADTYLARPEIAGPSVRFVRLRQIVVASSSKEPELVRRFGASASGKSAKVPVKPAPKADDDDDEEKTAKDVTPVDPALESVAGAMAPPLPRTGASRASGKAAAARVGQ